MKFGPLAGYKREEGWVKAAPHSSTTGLIFYYPHGLIMAISPGWATDVDIVVLDDAFVVRVLGRVAWYESSQILVVK